MITKEVRVEASKEFGFLLIFTFALIIRFINKGLHIVLDYVPSYAK